MQQYDIYGDIARRTNGDIYIGVVGPVRTGKSTFVSQFMNKTVIPKITDKNQVIRATDELPQSAEGRTIMTTEPKFVPNQAVKIDLQNMQVNVRLIDCVGYLVEGAMGHVEEGKPRLVKTPWHADAIPFEQAAETGTRKVVEEHSNIAIVITTDGTITDIDRTSYEPAEQRIVTELKQFGKPFVVIVNSRNPKSATCVALCEQLSKRYAATVIASDVANLSPAQIEDILRQILEEFPVRKITLSMPKWMQTLPPTHSLITRIVEKIKKISQHVSKMKDASALCSLFDDDEDFQSFEVSAMNMGDGTVNYALTPVPTLFFSVLSSQASRTIEDEFSLMSFVTECAYAKTQYDRIKDALDSVTATGYGVVLPSADQMQLEDPEIVKAGNRYGVRLRASAPSLHIMQVDVSTEVSPMVGTEQQSQYLLSEFQSNPKGIWQTNMFGKSLSSLAQEGLSNKVHAIPTDAQDKMRRTLNRIVNEGRGSLVCILL